MPALLPFDLNSHILPLAAFAVSMIGSPGPNNIMLTASGTNYGFVRTIPHIVGIMVGMLVMLFSVAAGLDVVFTRWPITHDILRFVGVGFLLYMAWRIATASSIQDAENKGRPMSTPEAALFQFLNPKAWLIHISAITTFSISGPQYWPSTFVICGIFLLVMCNTLPMWTAFGMLIRRWLSTQTAITRFNRMMGLLTASSVMMILN